MAKSRRDSAGIHPSVVVTFLILAIIAAMSLAAEVLKPLALSILLAFALTPFALVLERRLRFPRVAAVLFTVIVSLGLLAGIGLVVGKQLSSLAGKLESYQENIERKLKVLKPSENSPLNKAAKMVRQVSEELDSSPQKQVPDVRVVSKPGFQEWLQAAVGPYLEFLGVGSLVLILVLFMMMNPEDLRDRIVQLFGRRRISVTTRAMDEIGKRISRYLATFTLVNSCFGVVIGVGLGLIGIPYALLWGSIAGMSRFIPYVGPATAFILPMLFSVAHFPGWIQALEVIALFAVVETLLNSYLEPVIYGKTTGISALGLLVAAMFWTWLWGLLGLLLSTPLTVCLAVLGKYVPGLSVFAVLLGEEADLEPEVRFYQRLVALDRDGAVEVVDNALLTLSHAEVFDSILVPALSRAERDADEGELDEQDRAFIWLTVGGVIDELEVTAQLNQETSEAAEDFDPDAKTMPETARIVGVATDDQADLLVLRMLAQLLSASKVTLEILNEPLSPMVLADRLSLNLPALVILSQVPPQGLTSARYQIRRLRARFASLPILVGRWGVKPPAPGSSNTLETLVGVGPSKLVTSLAEARDQILKRLAPAATIEEEIGVG